MAIYDIYVGQLVDIFRIGLLAALLYTAANTATVLNRWIPIALGALFVAVLIPTALAEQAGPDLATAIGVGLLSNATILAIMLAAKTLYDRFT